MSYPVAVPAEGPNAFGLGPANVKAEAILRDREGIVDDQEWTRKVEVTAAP